MNKLNFNQTGGFPLKTERLQELQTAFEIFNAYGALAGNLTIISGCELIGSTVKKGVVYIDGEPIEFREAAVTPTSSVIIIEEAVNRAFENGLVKQVYTIRYATFGTADVSWPWTDFKRVGSLKDIHSRILPPGTNPQLYCGSVAAIPTGWQLCDGTNGTPPLQGMFIVGYDPGDPDYNAIGKPGGAKKVGLTAAENGPHSHSYTQYKLDEEVSGTGNGVRGLNKSNSQAGSFTTGASGTGVAHENRPPYYTLAYIIYKG